MYMSNGLSFYEVLIFGVLYCSFKLFNFRHMGSLSESVLGEYNLEQLPFLINVFNRFNISMYFIVFSFVLFLSQNARNQLINKSLYIFTFKV